MTGAGSTLSRTALGRGAYEAFGVPAAVLGAGFVGYGALPERLPGCLLALAAYYLSRRNLLAGVATGALVVAAAGWIRG